MEWDRIADRLLAWESLDPQERAKDPAALASGNETEAAELRRRIELLRKFDAAFGTAATLAFDEGTENRGFPEVPGCSIRGILGRGGMGVVYRAWQQDLEREVAVKVLRHAAGTSAPRNRRFIREARVLARLRHDHIVPVYEAALHLGEPFFVMELMTGGSLADALTRFAEPREAARLVERVARAVEHAHRQEILHRDLKPANILLDEQGRPRVSDFGLAKLLTTDEEAAGEQTQSTSAEISTDDGETGLTATNAAVGTPPYMAPEQFGGNERIGPAADIWSLGVVLYELLTGRRPFKTRRPGDLRGAILHDEPPSPRSLRAEIPPALEAITVKCLAKSPAARYRSAGDLADDLARWLAGDAPLAYPDNLAGKLRRFVRRRSTLAVLIGLAVVAGVTGSGAAIVAYRNDPEREREAIEKALSAGRRATLAADLGPPRIRRTPIGAENSHLSTEKDRPFFVSTHEVALVELWPTPPPRYRFEAELRHEDNPGTGSIGLFFDYREPSPAVNQPTCYVVDFVDKGNAVQQLPAGGARVALSLAVFERRDQEHQFDHMHHIDRRIKHFPAPLGPNPPPWRRLRIDVGSKGITIHWSPGTHPDQENHVDDDSFRRHARLMSENIPMLRGYAGRPPERGSVGLYVSRSSASFRNVTLEPLIDEP